MTRPRSCETCLTALVGLLPLLCLATALPAQSPEPALHWVAMARQMGPVAYRDPLGALSPDGRWVAYVERDRVRVQPVEGGPVRVLGTGARTVRWIAWLPDSRRVAVRESTFDGSHAAWFVVDRVTGERAPLWPGRSAGGPDLGRLTGPGLAQLAEALLVSAGGSMDADEFERRLDRILELVDRALSIDPRLAGAFAVRGNAAMTRNDWADARHDFQRAIAPDPDDPRSHHWLAMLYSDAGHLDLGERAIAESLRLDPGNANAEGLRADLLAARGRWGDAMASARRVTELGNPYGHVAGALFLLAVDPGALHQAESEMHLALAKGTPNPPGSAEGDRVREGRNTAALVSLMDDVRAHRMWLFVATTRPGAARCAADAAGRG